MNPAVRAFMWLDELCAVKDDQQALKVKFDSMAGVLAEESDLETVTRTFMTIMRAPELEGSFDSGISPWVTPNFCNLATKGKLARYVLDIHGNAHLLKPYTEEETK